MSGTSVWVCGVGPVRPSPTRFYANCPVQAMPHLFTCPHCRSRTLVEDAYSGLRGQCATCDQPIEIPDFAAGAAGVPPARQGWMAHPKVRLILAAAVSLLVVALLLSVFLEVGGNAVATMQANRMRGQEISNLQQIASALNAYAADYGSYPLAPLDAQGAPLHSWRVLLLPYLNEDDLYARFDLSKPWHAAKNQELSFQMPAVYRPAAQAATSFEHETHYVLITGPNTLFPTPDQALGPADVIDAPSQTILVGETARRIGSNRSWIEPDDLDVRNMQMILGSAPETELGGNLDAGAVVATVDERGHVLSPSTTPQELRALLSPAGGEPLPSDILD